MGDDGSTGRARAGQPRHVVAPDRAPQDAAVDAWLYLTSSGWYLHVDDVLAMPDLAALLSADACWYFSYQDWERRRPRHWQSRAWRSWRKEELALATEQNRIVQAAFALPTLRPHTSPDY